MADATHYVIRGGIEGRERLRVLGRVMHSTSTALFARLGVGDGLACLDAGCGGGDVTLTLARMVGTRGRVVGVDIDETKLAIARDEAGQLGLTNVDFRTLDLRGQPAAAEFDVVYARFLLTHLRDPAAALRTMFASLRPGGQIAVEDIDFSGHFTYPRSDAFDRYHALYCATVTRRGGDPNIGPRLPLLLRECGFADVGVAVVQPMALTGETKLINPLTMQNIAGAVLEDGLATREEIDRIVRELYDQAADPNTVAGCPRVVQAWGRRLS
jgi:SAM-dependent methyltransferase